MYAEVFAGFWVFVFILFYLAEASNKKPIGIIASLLLILFSLWLLGDTINIRTGELNTYAQTITNIGTLNTSIAGTANSSIANYTVSAALENGTSSIYGTVGGLKNVTYTYTPLVATFLPIPIGNTLGFILLGLGLYLMFAYSVDTFTTTITR